VSYADRRRLLGVSQLTPSTLPLKLLHSPVPRDVPPDGVDHLLGRGRRSIPLEEPVRAILTPIARFERVGWQAFAKPFELRQNDRAVVRMNEVHIGLR